MTNAVAAPAPGLAALGQLKPMAVNNLQGKPVPTADAMLNRAHRDAVDRGFVVVGFRSEVVLAPTAPDNLCIVRATVLMKSLYEEGQPIYEFEGLGDANPETGSRVSGRLVSLAETRARTRAIAVALNTDEDVTGANPAFASRPAAPSAYAAPAPAAAPAAFAAPAAPTAAPTAAAAPAAAGVYQGFRNGIIPFGKHKGRHLTDPAVTLDDLDWMSKALTLADRTTPDHAKIADARAEIARRTGTAAPSAAPAPAPAMAAPSAAPAAAPFVPSAAPAAAAPVALATTVPAAGHAPAPLPAVPGMGVFPAAQAAAAPVAWPAAPAAAPAASMEPGALARLAATAASRGYAWPQLTQLVTQAYQVADPAMLSQDQLRSLEAQFAALPTVQAA